MGTTANLGIPYPEPSDLVTNGAAAMKAIADRLDAVLRAGMMRRGIPGTALPTIPHNGAAGSNLVWPTLIDSDGPAGTVPTYAVSGSDGVITVPAPGRYDIEVAIRFNANGTGRRALTLYANGTELRATEVAASATGLVTLSLQVLAVDFVGGEALKVLPFQNSGAGLALVGNETSNYFTVVRRPS